MKLSEAIASIFYEVHNAVKNNEYTHYWLNGGRASGKSSFVSLEIVFGLETDKEANAIIYRQVGATLADSVVAQIQWAINLLGLSVYWERKKSPHEFVRRDTGQRIIFRGNDDAEKSKGIKLAEGYFKYIWFEELTEFDNMEAISTVIRSIVRGSRHASIFYTYNPPKNAANWVNEECGIHKDNRLVHSSTYLDLPAAWLGEQFLEDARILKATNDMEYRWAFLGEVIGSGGLILTNWEVSDVSQNLDDYDAISIGQDFGFNHLNVVLLCGYRDSNIYILKEQVNRGYDTNEIISKCTMPKDRTMYCDSAEPDRIMMWQKAGYRAVPVQKEKGCIAAQIDYLKGRKIFVDKD
jgi:PBSX family phage terminase large subunit